MALPSTVTSTNVLPLQNYCSGPFKSSTGKYFMVGVASTATPNGPIVWFANDPEGTWTQDLPSVSRAQSLWASQEGDLIHIIQIGSDLDDALYSRYDMKAESWIVTRETIDAPKNAPILYAVSIASRGAGDPIVGLYSGDTDSIMGTAYDRLDYATRNTSGTWSSPTQAFGASNDEIHYTGASIIPGTGNGLHFFGRRSSDSFLLGRTLSSGGSLSTTINNGAATATSLLTNGISFDDAGTQRVIQGYKDSSTNEFHIWRMTESGGSVADVDVVTISTANDVDTQNNTPVGSLGVDGTIAQAAWSHDTDLDLYHDQADTPQASGDWGTDTEHRNAVTINRISCQVYNRDGARVLAMVYDDGGTIKYDEIDIDVVPANLSDVKFPQQSSYIGPYEI